MKIYALSFVIYAVPANVIAAMVYTAGRSRARLLAIEYPFIYLPWVTMILLSVWFFGTPEALAEKRTLLMFVTILQSVAAGVLGGLVVLPRLFFDPQRTAAKLAVALASGLLMSAVYFATRVILFVLLEAAAGTTSA